MPRPQCVRIDITLCMWMEQSGLGAVQHRLHTRRICESENPPTIGPRQHRSMPHFSGFQWHSLSFARCANNRYALRHHHLISAMRVKVSTTHEACLRRVSVDPPQNHQIFPIHIVEQLAFVDRLACIRCAFLVGNDQLGYEERVRYESAAEDPARLEIRTGVLLGEREKAMA